jgi:hypothetical protein
MKKILLISSLLLVALTGCAKSSSDESSTEPQTKNAALGDRYTDEEAKSLFGSKIDCADLEVRKFTASQLGEVFQNSIGLLQKCNLVGELSYEQLSQVSGDWFESLSKSSTQSLSIKVIKTLTKDQLTGLISSGELTEDQTKVATQSLAKLG